MSQCWPEGALRAHLDRELAPEEMEQVSAHLSQCAECAQRSVELAARAERVGMLLSALPEVLPEAQPEWITSAPQRPAFGSRWLGWAAALAAGAALAAWLLPHHEQPIAAPIPVVTAPPPPVTAQPQVESVASVKPVELPRKARRPRPQVPTVSNDFLALDDEPIETGIVMRVGVEPGNLQADVVFGPDGRAHAFRLVGTASWPGHH